MGRQVGHGKLYFCTEYLDDNLLRLQRARRRGYNLLLETRAFPARIPQTLPHSKEEPIFNHLNWNISLWPIDRSIDRLRKRSLIRTNWKFIAIRNKLGRRLLSSSSSLQWYREFVNQTGPQRKEKTRMARIRRSRIVFFFGAYDVMSTRRHWMHRRKTQLFEG